MNVLISKENLDELWHRDQVTFPEQLRMYLYWHQQLQHPSHVLMVRLIERGALPSAIKYAKKTPPCAACLFAKAQTIEHGAIKAKEVELSERLITPH
eukprot:857303-Ditylum_brightwellii.AAC.1